MCVHSVAKLCPTLCNPMDCSTPGFPVLHCLPELAQIHVHWVSNAIQPSHPLSSPSPFKDFLVAQLVKNPPAMPETWFWSLGWADPLKKGKATHSSVFGLSWCSVGKEWTCNVGDLGLIPGLGRSPEEGIGYLLQYSWASLMAQLVKNPPAMQETWVRSLGWADPLKKGKATHSSSLAWRIPMDRGAGRAQSMGSQRVRSN